MAQKSLKVLFVISEAAPFVTAGGLGEVAQSLPKALSQLTAGQNQPKIDIKIVLPFYPFIKFDPYTPELVAEFQIPHRDGNLPGKAYHIQTEERMHYYFIQGDPIEKSTKSIYAFDAAQDGLKFTFFSLAALELTKRLDWQPDILHANDWHTAPAVYWLALNRAQDNFFQNTVSILNLHNLPYLGDGAGPEMNAFGLPPASDSRLPIWAQNIPLPLGLLTADEIVAVSPGYAQEILTREYGAGLHVFLNTRTESITGILNGIDYDTWNPSQDNAIHQKFTENQLDIRSKNKTYLQKTYGFPILQKIPLLVVVSRFDQQKGVDLILDSLLQITDRDWQAILLGTGHPDLENAARRLEKILPDRVKALIKFDKQISRQLYSGGDAILIPSRYEPCGLTQMIGMRYGCVPIARATGGLRDTIQDYTRSAESTGFLFQSETPEGLAGAIRRALYVFSLDQPWREIQRRGMALNLSWDRSAEQYRTLYTTVLDRHREKNK